MSHSNQRELEKMALAGELAGQLGHDFGAFVHQLLTLLDLAETRHDRQLDWQSMRREGKLLMGLLREWQQFRGPPEQPREIDLNELIQELVGQMRGKGRRSSIRTSVPPVPARLVTFPAEARRLCQLLLLHAVSSSTATDGESEGFTVETRTDKDRDKILVLIEDVATCDLSLLDKADDESSASPSLLIKACRSLALLLDAKLRADRQPDKKITIVVEFPKQV